MNFISDIENLLMEKTCIIGIGNYLMKDDAVGLYIVDELKKRVHDENLFFLNAEDVLENYVFQIAACDFRNIIIVDAVKTNSNAGFMIFGRLNELNEIIDDYSTHKLSLKLSGKILQESGKEIYLLGIEVKDIEFEAGLSLDVKMNTDMFIDIFASRMNGRLCGDFI